VIKDLTLPDLGEGIDGAEVSEITVSVGDRVTAEDTVLVLESDKASMEIPAEATGEIQKILVSVGDLIKTGQKLLTIDSVDSKTKEKETPLKIEKPRETKEEKKKKEKEPLELETLKTGSTENVFASPGVRRLARELNINLQIIKGTGVKGRITKDDLNGYIKLQMMMVSAGPSQSQLDIDFSQWGETEVQKLTKIQKITGQRLQRAWQNIPHVTQFDEADITSLDSFRKKLKKKAERKGIKVTFLPFLIKAITKTLKEFPVFNSSLDSSGQNLVLKNYINIGVAVDTSAGLIVPVIKEADNKSIIELSEELTDLSARARKKRLKPKELMGGTFTISSLGGIGGRFFTPIVNPPEVAILGVSRSFLENKSILKLPFSLSYDHRVIDGAAAASFTTKLSEILFSTAFFEDKEYE